MAQTSRSIIGIMLSRYRRFGAHSLPPSTLTPAIGGSISRRQAFRVRRRTFASDGALAPLNKEEVLNCTPRG